MDLFPLQSRWVRVKVAVLQQTHCSFVLDKPFHCAGSAQFYASCSYSSLCFSELGGVNVIGFYRCCHLATTAIFTKQLLESWDNEMKTNRNLHIVLMEGDCDRDGLGGSPAALLPEGIHLDHGKRGEMAWPTLPRF